MDEYDNDGHVTQETPVYASGETAPPPAPKRRRWDRVAMRTSLGVAVLVVGLAGALIGHVTWQNGTTNALTSTGGASRSVQNPGPGLNLPGGWSITLPGGGSANGSANGSQSNGSGSASTSIGGPTNAASIAQGVDSGLVDINTKIGYENAEAAGTGIVLSSDGEVLTNNHVIEDASSISVTDIGNGKTYNATVVGYSRSSDVALVQLQNASGLQTAKIGDSSALKVGDGVVGVGNAGGVGGTPSYAGGAVTALHQNITASDDANSSTEQLKGLIATNANIQAGDSGGPLVNTNGEVVGMDTAGSSNGGFVIQLPNSNSTSGFAIPINTALSIVQAIKSGQTSSDIHVGGTAFLGVEVQSVSSSNAGNGFGNGFGGGFGGSGQGPGFGGSGQGSTTPTLPSAGALIAGVVTGSPAAKAGLGQGDTIVSVNKTSVTSPDGLSTQLLKKKPGTKVQIGYVDSTGTKHTVTVRLASGPAQ